ncbi:Uma2 family endonuclease [Thermosynechococcus sp. HN-54]|nr:Uma2 family endonuclease [Thermosynechococcus sp. HN-54]
MPLEEHEFASGLIGLFLRILVVETGLRLRSLRSTTLWRPDLERGAELDNAYYIHHQPQVAGCRIDLRVDPPPDLVIEVEMTPTDIDKNRLYAALGVPKLWRYNGEEWQIFRLRDGCYQGCDRSLLFPWVTKECLYHFLAEAKMDEVEAEKNWRRWVQEQRS